MQPLSTDAANVETRGNWSSIVTVMIRHHHVSLLTGRLIPDDLAMATCLLPLLCTESAHDTGA